MLIVQNPTQFLSMGRLEEWYWYKNLMLYNFVYKAHLFSNRIGGKTFFLASDQAHHINQQSEH